MSTRGCIARSKGDGFAGVYHHSSSYPTGLGKTLWETLRGHFQGDLERMLNVLIDKHPAGWSTINGADWSFEPGFVDAFRDNRPRCYCHGERHEEASLMTDKTASPLFIEWVYAFDEEHGRLAVFASRETAELHGHKVRGEPLKRDRKEKDGCTNYGTCVYGHELVFCADLDGPEPDWQVVECGERLERCHHYRSCHDLAVVDDYNKVAGTGAQEGYLYVPFGQGAHDGEKESR